LVEFLDIMLMDDNTHLGEMQSSVAQCIITQTIYLPLYFATCYVFKKNYDGGSRMVEIKPTSYMEHKKNNSKLGKSDRESMIMHRHNMISYTLKHGIKAAAKTYQVNRGTVYKWLNAYSENGMEGLKNKSRIGQSHPNKLSADMVKHIVDCRKELPVGAEVLKHHYKLPCSAKKPGA